MRPYPIFIFLFLIFCGKKSYTQQSCQVYYDATVSDNTITGNVIINPKGPINITNNYATPIEDIKAIKELIGLLGDFENDPELNKLSLNEQVAYIKRKTEQLQQERAMIKEERQGIAMERKSLKKAKRSFEEEFQKEAEELNQVIATLAQKNVSPAIQERIEAAKSKADRIINSTNNCLGNDFKVVPLKDVKTGEIVFGFSLEEIRKDPNYVLIDDYSEGLARVKRNNKYGFYDTKGNRAIPFQFDYAESFQDGFALVSNIRKWYLIDKSGERVFEFPTLESKEGNKFTTFRPNIFKCNNCVNGSKYIIKKGNELLEIDEIEKFNSDGNAIIRKRNQEGIVNEEGKLMLDCKYPDVQQVISTNGIFYSYREPRTWKHGLLDHFFNDLLSPIFDNIILEKSFFDGGYVLVENGKKRGVVRLDGKEVLPMRYQSIMYYQKEDAFIVNDGKIFEYVKSGGFPRIDYLGIKEVYPFDENGFAFFKMKNDSWGVMNGKGRVINEKYWESISKTFRDKFYLMNGRYQSNLYNAKGKLAIAEKFRSIELHHFDENGEIFFSTDDVTKRKEFDIVELDKNGRVIESPTPPVKTISNIVAMTKKEIRDVRRDVVILWLYDFNSLEFKKIGAIDFYRPIEKFREVNKGIYALSSERELCFIDIINNRISKEYMDYHLTQFDSNNNYWLFGKGKYLLLDRKFEETSDKYSSLELCPNGMYRAVNTATPRRRRRTLDPKNLLYGYLDSSGKLLIELKFMEAELFENTNPSLSIVRNREEKYGVIDSYGAEIVVLNFDKIERTKKGFRVQFRKKKFLVDENGVCYSKNKEKYNQIVSDYHDSKK